MKYKLIASDFDGTIYTSDYHIASGTQEAISEFVKKGGTMMISTGRLYESIKQHFPALGLTSGCVIVEQGANVVDVATDKILLSYNIEMDDALSCLDMIEKTPKTMGLIYFDGKCFAPSRNELTDFFEKIIQVKINYVGTLLSNYVRDNKISPTKVLGLCMPEDQGDLADRINATFENLTCARSAVILIEVVNKRAGKGNALKHIAEDVYNIKREEVVALGDSENDLSMIKYAGLGVAMGNAMDNVKKVADLVVDTNDNSGVAKFIREYCLGD